MFCGLLCGFETSCFGLVWCLLVRGGCCLGVFVPPVVCFVVISVVILITLGCWWFGIWFRNLGLLIWSFGLVFV